MRTLSRLLHVSAFALLAAAAPALAIEPGGEAPEQVSFAPARVVPINADSIFNQRVQNGERGLLQLLFPDGMSITLGPSAALTIDFFTHDAAAGTAGITATLHQGAARFIGGTTGAKSRSVALRTAFGTLDLSGAMADVDLGDETQSPHFDMIFGKEMRLVREDRVIGRVFAPGYSIVPDPDGNGASVRKTPAEWKSAIHRRLVRQRSQAPSVAADATMPGVAQEDAR